jgi:hypothetical protein
LPVEAIAYSYGLPEALRQTPAPQMSLTEFNAALKRHGFRVVRAKIEDATGVITHPYPPDQAAVRSGAWAARASRMAASAV